MRSAKEALGAINEEKLTLFIVLVAIRAKSGCQGFAVISNFSLYAVFSHDQANEFGVVLAGENQTLADHILDRAHKIACRAPAPSFCWRCMSWNSR